MALTEEQIKNLKPGDPIIIHGTFKRIFEDGDIVSRIKTTDLRGKVVNNNATIHPSCVSLSQENVKCNPYRLFKKGDKVRIVEWNGRKRSLVSSMNASVLTTCEYFFVKENEDDSLVYVTDDRKIGYMCLPPCYLELITPVEEIEPYYIEETEYEFCVTIMVGERKDTPATYHKKMHPNAKAAAEAECKRLNEEWRKNKNND